MKAMHIAPALLAAVLLVGCARGERADATRDGSAAAADPAPGNTAAPAAPRNACALITVQELQATTSLQAPGQSSRSGSADVCTWLAGADGAAIVQIHSSPAEFDTARTAFQQLYGGTAQDVSGIGDRAFYIEGQTSSIATSTLTTQRGTTPVTVQILGGDDAQRRQRAEALARVALEKL